MAKQKQKIKTGARIPKKPAVPKRAKRNHKYISKKRNKSGGYTYIYPKKD